MNKIYTKFTAFAFFISIAISSFAQLNVVHETNVDFEDQSRAAVSLEMEPELKDASKAFSKYLKSNYDVKIKGRDMMEANAVTIGSVSDKTMDLFVKLEEKDDHTVMNVFGRFGYDVFINSNSYPEVMSGLKATVQDFAQTFLKEYYLEKIEDREKMLGKTRDKIEDRKEDVVKLEEKNADAHEDIDELKGEIDENKEEITLLQEAVDNLDGLANTHEQRLSQMRERLQTVTKN